jgi:hypothetical protein
MKSHFPNQKISKFQFPFYPFRTGMGFAYFWLQLGFPAHQKLGFISNKMTENGNRIKIGGGQPLG